MRERIGSSVAALVTTQAGEMRSALHCPSYHQLRHPESRFAQLLLTLSTSCSRSASVFAIHRLNRKALPVFSPIDAVARIAQSWENIALLIQLAVECGGENRNVGVSVVESFDPLGSSH